DGPPRGRAAALWLAVGALAMAVAVLVAAALAGQPGAAAIVAALVPLLGLPALFPGRPPPGRGASAPIVTAALAAAVGGALPLIGLLGEPRPVRAVLLVGQVPAAAAWLALASGASGGPAAAVALLLGRALGLTLALLALDALERLPALSWRTPHRRRLLAPA